MKIKAYFYAMLALTKIEATQKKDSRLLSSEYQNVKTDF